MTMRMGEFAYAFEVLFLHTSLVLFYIVGKMCERFHVVALLHMVLK